ncbi:protein TPX2 [Macadamia integrifolia]|uniref:protein TPX2 n=1 Tax=Macadamia integrifolia TaxID=60698 RepID=UPI001C4FA18B|nr:protein TPX2 [Macadamia integrifolia]
MDDCNTMIDETYEFSAPRYFDFINGESEEEKGKAELWFESALSYAPSPFMPRIKTGRSVHIEALCNFSDAEQMQKATGSSETSTASHTTAPADNSSRLESELVSLETTKEEEKRTTPIEEVSLSKKSSEDLCIQQKESVLAANSKSSIVETGKASVEATSSEVPVIPSRCHNSGTETCTPKPQIISRKEETATTNSMKNQKAKKIASLVKNPSALKPKNRCELSKAKSGKPASSESLKTAKNTVAAPDFAQENQAIKRQKLDGGRTRQILNIKTHNLPHKSKPAANGGGINFLSSTTKTCKEDRKVYVREPAAPFVSMAEMVKKFESKTRGIDLTHGNNSLSHDDAASITQRKPRLTLTRPKEPEFETANRLRPLRVKSTAELEEEMMAKIPKFKARPVNKKILEASTLPALPRSIPQQPEFQEFHLKTLERANQHAETSSVVSESSCQNQGKPYNKLTEPKTPRLETLLRARPPKIKSSQELELEELEKMPKFKARPLNKKIFESKGELGMFCNTKRNVTRPQEFHFATDERIPPQTSVVDLFDKLSLNSEPRNEYYQMRRVTTPNPFHLHTEERGEEKEKKFLLEVLQKQWEEERARVPKATPYPYTTDYPVVPPKPERKKCTQPEPFQLESLVRHEEEVQRELEERQRMEKEEAQMRVFKAQPVMKDDPIPVPEKARKPLTQVQEFELQVDHRVIERSEFDKKIKEKEMTYKRYREEHEAAKMMEEEKALKQMRRTMVPHARPLPNFNNPFLPQKSSKETTKAKSPKLRVIQRKERKRMMMVNGAISSAASNMR